MTTTGVVLAAGKGARMQSKTPKALHKVAGVSLVGHCVRIMRNAGLDEIIVVASNEFIDSQEFTNALFADTQVAIQEEQLGTANALSVVRSKVSMAENLVVAPVDMILVTDSDIRRMVNRHRDTKAVVTLLGSRVDDPTGLGRVRLGASGQPIDVLEEHEADAELLSNNLVNTSWYCFDSHWIWDALDPISPAETGELYLPKVVESAANVDRSQIVVAENPESGIGINDRVQLAIVEKITRNRTNQTHMTNGVTLQDPENTYIDIDVQIGPDTEIRAGAHIGTRTSIGSDVIIGPNTQIYDSQIGNFAEINGARIIESVVGERGSIRPNSLIRDGSNLMLGSKIGNQAEIKNSIVGAGSQISHFSYVGDATLGENVNIGAGTVTCNYDGNDKHLTVIEDDVFVGSGTMLIAPITVGKAARTGAGSVVRTDVAAGDTVAGVPAKSIKSK